MDKHEIERVIEELPKDISKHVVRLVNITPCKDCENSDDWDVGNDFLEAP